MPAQSRTLTIMLSDMVEFTSKTSRMSREGMMEMLRGHDELLRPVIRHHGGRVVKTIGDAFMSVFESPTDAVLCAIRSQFVLQSYNKDRPEDKQIHVRIALNAGEVQLTEDGDVFGEAVNIVARVEGVTPADEIFFTEPVYLSMNRNEIPATLNVKLFNFKGVKEEVTVYKVLQNTSDVIYQKIIESPVEPVQDHSPLLALKRTFGRRGAFPAMGGAAWHRSAAIAISALFVVLLLTWAWVRLSTPPSLSDAAENHRSVATIESASSRTKPSPARPAMNERDTYVRDLRSPDPNQQRDAAKRLIRSRAFDKYPELLEIAGEELLKRDQTPTMIKDQLDALGWLCHLLGMANTPQCQAVLEKVASDSPNEKTRRYAARYLPNARAQDGSSAISWEEGPEALEAAAQKLTAVFRPSATATERETYASDLRSPDPIRQRDAAKRLARSRAFEKYPEVLQIASDELMKKYQTVSLSDDQLDALGWLCHLLGVSAKPEFKPILEKVQADCPHEKLRRYAARYLKTPDGGTVPAEPPATD